MRELPCSGVSMAQGGPNEAPILRDIAGTTGFGATGFGGKISDVLRVFSILVSKKEVNCEVVVDEKHFQVAVPTEGGFPGSGSESVQAVQAEPVAPWQVKILYIL